MNADSGEHEVPKLPPPFVRRTETPPGSAPAQRVVQPPYARGRSTGEHQRPVETAAAVETVQPETLPSIKNYLYATPVATAAQAAAVAEPSRAGAPESAPTQRKTPEKLGSSGSWVLGEWQKLESQRSTTATVEADTELAHEAWSDLDWEEDVGLNRRKRPAEMVAVILERVARRIRAGEIRVAGTPGMSEEAALAAALAALLGVHRP